MKGDEGGQRDGMGVPGVQRRRGAWIAPDNRNEDTGLTEAETASGRVEADRMGGRKEGWAPSLRRIVWSVLRQRASACRSSGPDLGDVVIFCGVGQAKRRWKGREKLSEELREPPDWRLVLFCVRPER